MRHPGLQRLFNQNKDIYILNDQNLQAHFAGSAAIFDIRRELDTIIPASQSRPQPAQIIPFKPDLSPKPGQSDADVEACLRSFNRPLERAKAIYAVRLYQTRPDPSTDAAAWGAWYDALTDYQRDILNERRRAKCRTSGRAAYALARAAEGKEVRPYVRGKTAEQLREDAAARQRKRRAKQGAQPRVDLSRLSPEELRAHKAAQRREQRARARAALVGAEVKE